jgi:hypothetical protein
VVGLGRDVGVLDLDDRLGQHVSGLRDGSPTIRRLLAHLPGFQREPGEMWVSREAPTIDELLAATDTHELVLSAARHWDRGWGLGLELLNRDGKFFGGHGGAMPGHLAGVYVHRESGIGAAVLTNAGTRASTTDAALELATTTFEHWPPETPPWCPEGEPPEAVRSLLGRWWSEGNEFVFTWEKGQLHARAVGAPPWWIRRSLPRLTAATGSPRDASAANDCASTASV